MLPSFFVVLAFAPAFVEDDPKYPELIVGVWTTTIEVKGEKVPLMIAFTKEGKMTTTYEVQGVRRTIESTYAIEKDKLLVSRKGKDDKEKTEMSTIKEASGDTLILFVESEKVERKYKRKK